ncbi:unnamed protein product, partial [Oppiella nova]
SDTHLSVINSHKKYRLITGRVRCLSSAPPSIRTEVQNTSNSSIRTKSPQNSSFHPREKQPPKPSPMSISPKPEGKIWLKPKPKSDEPDTPRKPSPEPLNKPNIFSDIRNDFEKMSAPTVQVNVEAFKKCTPPAPVQPMPRTTVQTKATDIRTTAVKSPSPDPTKAPNQKPINLTNKSVDNKYSADMTAIKSVPMNGKDVLDTFDSSEQSLKGYHKHSHQFSASGSDRHCGVSPYDHPLVPITPCTVYHIYCLSRIAIEIVDDNSSDSSELSFELVDRPPSRAASATTTASFERVSNRSSPSADPQQTPDGHQTTSDTPVQWAPTALTSASITESPNGLVPKTPSMDQMLEKLTILSHTPSIRSTTTTTVSPYVMVDQMMETLALESQPPSESSTTTLTEAMDDSDHNDVNRLYVCNDGIVFYKVVTRDHLIQDVMTFVAQMQELVSLPFNDVWNLIVDHNWDKEKLMSEVFDETSVPYNLLREMSIADTQVVNNFCRQCFNDTPKEEDGFALSCGHHYCNRCWAQYLTSRIESAVNIKEIRCAHDLCHRLVDWSLVEPLLVDQVVRDKLAQLVVNSFVNHRRGYRFCANTSCCRIVKMMTPGVQTIACVCDTEFCNRCGQRKHWPLPCELTREWALRVYSEIKGNFADIKSFCGVCRSTIVWKLVMSPMSKFELFFARIQSNSQMIVKETEVRDGLFKPHTSPPIAGDIVVLHHSFTSLYECRLYYGLFLVFAYFCQNTPQFDIFTQNLNAFESHLETLSKILMGDDGESHRKSDLLMTKTNCLRFKDQLINHITEGVDELYWSYDFQEFVAL